MTEEELFRVYIKRELCAHCRFPQFCKGEDACSDIATAKRHYLAGLEAGKGMAEVDLATVAYMQGAERYKPKWHKVADNDYPPCEKGYCTINVLTDCGDIAYYNYDEECWVAEPLSTEIDPPVAWCGIPKYEE